MATRTRPDLDGRAPRIHQVVSGAGEAVGGMSTHVCALQCSLRASGWACDVLSPGALLRKRRRLAPHEVAHVHVSLPSRLRLVILVGFLVYLGPRRCVLTVHHGPAAAAYSRSRTDRVLLGMILGRLGGVVALTAELSDFFARFAPRARLVPSGSYVGKAGAAGTDPDPEPSAVHEVAGRTRQWLCTSGYESPLYGFEGVVAAAAALAADGPIGVRICTYGPPSDAYVDAVQAVAVRSGVPYEWYRNLGSSAFHAVLARGDVYVRNTSGDSFGLAIGEALSLGVPVVASNVCNRPVGTVVFPARDQRQLEVDVSRVLRLGPLEPAQRDQAGASLAALAERNVEPLRALYAVMTARTNELATP